MDFADLYRSPAEKDPDILSIPVSSALNSTVNAAGIAAGAISKANLKTFDTKTISGVQGRHVEVAAKAARAGLVPKKYSPPLRAARQSVRIDGAVPALASGSRDMTNIRG